MGYFGGRGFTPVIHDEYAYLFQAKTFANWRLCYPPPEYPQFFDAFHLLTEGVYASKYPPGHALVLVPGVWVGFPMLMPLLLSVGSLLIFYYLIKSIQNQKTALCSMALFAVCAPQVDMATTYQSHSTTLFFLLLFLYAVLRSFELRSVVYPLIAGSAVGIAFAARPLTALAVAGPFVFYYLVQVIRDVQRQNYRCLRHFLILAMAFSPAVVGLLEYNSALMGSPFKFPWSEYSQRYMPADNLGFGVGEETVKSNISPRKTDFYQGYVLTLKRKYSLASAIKQLLTERVRDTLLMADNSIGLVIFLPLAFIAPLAVYEKLMVASVVSLFLAHFAYYGWLPSYHFEIIPFVVYFIVRGTMEIFSKLYENKLRLTLLFFFWQLGWGTLFLASFKIPQEIYFKRLFTQYHAAFGDLLGSVGAEPKVIFVKYRADHNFHFDLINNDPDLESSRNIFALDLGEENQKIIHFYQNRSFFRFDEKAWRIQKLSRGSPE
jgi:4-amino-4-deoxy-L-arabinose transferase-like glycosyltransferase